MKYPPHTVAFCSVSCTVRVLLPSTVSGVGHMGAFPQDPKGTQGESAGTTMWLEEGWRPGAIPQGGGPRIPHNRRASFQSPVMSVTLLLFTRS